MNPSVKRLKLSGIALLGFLALAGCSSSSPPAGSAEQHATFHFNLDQCQPLQANLYKCPAADKPICNPDYSGPLECIRTGPKGSIFVQYGQAY